MTSAKFYVKMNKNAKKSENIMVTLVDCPRCYGGILKINIANGYKVITDGRPSKMPLKTVCKNCNRNIKYIVVRDEDYEKTLAFVQQK